MKKALLLSVFLLSIFSCYCQKNKFVGTYEASGNLLERHMQSTISLTQDSFELTYTFLPVTPPQKEFTFHKVERPSQVSTEQGNVAQQSFKDWRGARQIRERKYVKRTYRGVWDIDNTKEFMANGWNFPVMYNATPDSLAMHHQHLTATDASRIVLICDNGNKLQGAISDNYYPTKAIFLDNFISDVYFYSVGQSTK